MHYFGNLVPNQFILIVKFHDVITVDIKRAYKTSYSILDNITKKVNKQVVIKLTSAMSVNLAMMGAIVRKQGGTDSRSLHIFQKFRDAGLLTAFADTTFSKPGTLRISEEKEHFVIIRKTLEKFLPTRCNGVNLVQKLVSRYHYYLEHKSLFTHKHQ